MHNSTTIVRAKRSRASCILSTFSTVTHAYSYFFNKLCPWLGSTWCFDPALFKQSRDHYTIYLWFFYVMHVTPRNMYSWNLRPEQRQYASNSRCGTKPLSAFEILRHPLGCWSSLKTSSAGSSINQDTRSLLRCLLLPEAGTGHKRRASKRISEAPDAVPRELAPTGSQCNHFLSNVQTHFNTHAEPPPTNSIAGAPCVLLPFRSYSVPRCTFGNRVFLPPVRSGDR